PGRPGVTAGRPDPDRVVRGGGTALGLAAARPPPAPIEGLHLWGDCRRVLLHRCDLRLLSDAVVRAGRAGAVTFFRRLAHRAPVCGVDCLESASWPYGRSVQRPYRKHRGP